MKDAAVFSYRVATPRRSLSLAHRFSTRCRCLYAHFGQAISGSFFLGGMTRPVVPEMFTEFVRGTPAIADDIDR